MKTRPPAVAGDPTQPPDPYGRHFSHAVDLDPPATNIDRKKLKTAASTQKVALAALNLYQREPVERLLKLSEVVALTGMCRSSVYNRLRDGDFVRCVKVGPRSIRFPESEIRKWIAKRLWERDAQGGQDACA